ncbi:hypothetical protein [Wielerella bovis]|uniref:hypothetical protein n=1 Tax=Wielerella bovis TaxID=2917790 RepID=UPI0020187C53|nr:hypothetical protein [Wielerella bovis]ULJ65525.1 hypothetical protein MIS33_04490 [Wielerella bovis]ULJ66431.1 hypothetical protein MIS31_09215 [Wielerella bovis]
METELSFTWHFAIGFLGTLATLLWQIIWHNDDLNWREILLILLVFPLIYAVLAMIF